MNERPPVLAQIRFAERRGEFEGLGLAERFARIHETNLWGADQSVSGAGSEVDATGAIRAALPALLRRLDVQTLLDAPCGDFAWMKRLDLGTIRYIGADIVPALIADLRARETTAARQFHLADITRDTLGACNLILCRDCLVHLSFANIAAALANFTRTGARYLLTTTFPGIAENHDIADGDWRALNFEKPPFSWPAPLALIDERCEEMHGAWRDKSLALWRLGDVAGG
jgi:hypothetical protein